MSRTRQLDLNLKNKSYFSFLVVIKERNKLIAYPTEDKLLELKELARSANLEVVGATIQKLKFKNPATLLGLGILGKIKQAAKQAGARIILFSEELKPNQQKNLEDYFAEDFKIIDRTALILEIFASRAKSQEGKLQVELAKAKYRLPRLSGQGLELEQQTGRSGGGVGLRGPGEKKLEIERRAIRHRIQILQKEIAELRQQRERLRDKRRQYGFFTVALAGYTNSGKSTLLNKLALADIKAEDKYFSTLDPTTRRVRLPAGPSILLTDTVGFINELPKNLAVAFKATFEEILEADLILHLLDASDPKVNLKQKAVCQELSKLGFNNKEIIEVWNKADRLSPLAKNNFNTTENQILISALTGENLDELLLIIERFYLKDFKSFKALLPYGEKKLISLLRQKSAFMKEAYKEDGLYLEGQAPDWLVKKISLFII